MLPAEDESSLPVKPDVLQRRAEQMLCDLPDAGMLPDAVGDHHVRQQIGQTVAAQQIKITGLQCAFDQMRHERQLVRENAQILCQRRFSMPVTILGFVVQYFIWVIPPYFMAYGSILRVVYPLIAIVLPLFPLFRDKWQRILFVSLSCLVFMYVADLVPCAIIFTPEQMHAGLALPPAELLDAEAAQQFIRCHQSYWVNFRQIETMENDCFLLPGGLRVPISRTYRSTAREQFFSRLQI